MNSSSADKVIALYDRHAAAWIEKRGQHLIEKGWLDAFLDALPSAGRKIVDIGCGSGIPIADYLIQNGCTVTGVDGAATLIEHAKTKLPDHRWLVADMRALPVLGRFDGTIAWHSFFHLRHDDQRRMFRTFRCLATPGTALMFTSGTTHGEIIGDFEGKPLYHSSLNPAEYRELLRSNGFETIRHVEADASCGEATVWLARRSD